MIVNPPRSEAEFTSRLRSISVHAADKNEDPDDRPPLIPRWVGRRLALLALILFVASVIRGGLWVMTERPVWFTNHAERAEMYRRLAREAEADALACRGIASSGNPVFIRNVGLTVNPVLAPGMATQFDKSAAAFRRQAFNEECLNLGIPIP